MLPTRRARDNTPLRRPKPESILRHVLLGAEDLTHNQIATKMVQSLEAKGWALVPKRAPVVSEERMRAMNPVEGEITSRNLIEAAAEFDSANDGDETYPAADFVAWYLPEVKGSPEWLWLERRRAR